MATKKVLVQIKVEGAEPTKKVTKEVDKLAEATKKLEHELTDEAKALAQVNLQTAHAKKANKELAQSNIDMANSTEKVTKGLNEMKTTAGLSGAIVTEFGRTISDAPYGIRGMGNNLSQLGSLFGVFAVNVKKSGRSMTDGFKEIFGQMKGIIGIMTALQVVVAIAQTEWFQKWTEGLFSVNKGLKEFGELMKETSKIAGESVGQFKVYVSLLQDENLEQEERVKLIKQLNEEYPEFNASLFESTEQQEKQNEAVEDYIKLLKQRARAEAAMSKFREAEAKILDLETSTDARTAPIEAEIEKLKELGYNYVLSTNQINSIIKDGYTTKEDITNQAIALRQNEINQIEKENEKEIEAEKKKQKSLEKYFDAGSLNSRSRGSSKSKTSNNAPLRAFKQGSLLLNTEEQSFNNKRIALNRRTQEQIIEDQREASEISIDIKLEEFKAKEKIRFESYLKTAKLTDEQKEEAKEDYLESIELAEKEAESVIKAIQKVSQKKQELREIDQANAKKDREAGLSEAGGQSALARSETELAKLDSQKALDDLLYDNKVAQLNRLLELETEDTEKRKDLINELAIYKIQKSDTDLLYARKVEDAKYDLTVQGVNAIASILGKQTKAGKIAAATAATINTYQAITKTLAETTDPTPTQSLRIANAAVIGLAGFAQVKNILSTNSPNSSRGSSSGGIGSTTVQAPDFNIIGSSGTNQLAEAIGSTEKQDIRAYVVTSDITTKQALTRNIRESSEI